MKTKRELTEREKRHQQNVSDAFAAARNGETINLSALMCGANQTGAGIFETVKSDVDGTDNGQLDSDNWRVAQKTLNKNGQ